MEACAFSSGSSGNCFYVGVEGSSNGVLIDAGLSSKNIVSCLDNINKSPENIKAIFITHEHLDHVRGVSLFSKKFNIPVFATLKTFEHLNLEKNLAMPIKSNSIENIAGLEIRAFSKFHKAEDPVSFLVNHKRKTLSVITDIGKCCDNSAEAVNDSNLIFLESNHDIRMLEDGNYPFFLKKWIKSDIGHLSNSQAGLMVLEHGSKKLSNVILSHLSDKNNLPALAFSTFNSLVSERSDMHIKIDISSKGVPTNLYRL